MPAPHDACWTVARPGSLISVGTSASLPPAVPHCIGDALSLWFDVISFRKNIFFSLHHGGFTISVSTSASPPPRMFDTQGMERVHSRDATVVGHTIDHQRLSHFCHAREACPKRYFQIHTRMCRTDGGGWVVEEFPYRVSRLIVEGFTDLTRAVQAAREEGSHLG